jgi:hypothetical protein
MNYNFTIKDIIKDNIVEFYYYRKGFLYYRISLVVNGKLNNYQFPVPLSDTGDATFNATDKAIFFMRYINKAMKEGVLELVG